MSNDFCGQKRPPGRGAIPPAEGMKKDRLTGALRAFYSGVRNVFC